MSRPFDLWVLGDFGGTRHGGELVRVDRERFDAVVERLEVHVPIDAARTMRVTGLESLHPDAILSAIATVPPDVAPAPPSSPAPTVATQSGLLDQILVGGGREPAAREAVAAFARTVAEPSLRRGERLDDAELARRQTTVRAVLRDPTFRCVEAAWRGLHALVWDAEVDAPVVVRIVDVERDAAALRLAEILATPGCDRPARVVGAYRFGPGDRDLAELERLGAVCAAAGTMFVGDAAPALLGLESIAELGDPDVRRRIGVGPAAEVWHAFRAGTASEAVCLCLPRILLRLPYGAAGDPVTSMPFEELRRGDDHDAFLWGSGAVAHARLLVRAFCADGWDADLARHDTLDGLPLYVWRDGTEEQVLPCAEVALHDATIARLVDEGFGVWAWERGSDRGTWWGGGAR